MTAEPNGALTHAQQRFWLAEMAAPGAADNLLVLAYVLTGPLRIERLQAALTEVVRAHPALRTTYPWRGDAPVQHVIAPEAAKLVVEHVAPPSDVDGHDTRALAEAVTADWWRTPFALEDEVPLRIRLCRLSGERHLLCVQVHHIAFDGWSESVLIDDLRAAYEGRPIGDRTGQGGAWETSQLAAWAERDLPFWRERTARPPAPFLPAPSRRVEATRRETVVTVDAATVAALTTAAARRGGPVLGALVAAAGRAFARTFSASELAVGSVSAGRFVSDVESTIGYFVNPFQLRLSGVDSLSPEGLLDQSVHGVVAALAHVATPFDELVRELGPDRTRHPWFQAWVILQRQPPCGALGDVTVEPVRVRPPTTATELLVEAIPTPDGAWEVVISWRDDGVDVEQAHSVERELCAALTDLAGLAKADRGMEHVRRGNR